MPIKILITGIGFQGGFDLAESLRKNGFEVIGADADENSAARFYCDKFYKIPTGEIENQYYLPELLKIIEKERPVLLLPASVSDLYHICLAREVIETLGVKIMAGPTGAVKTALDKGLTYDVFRGERFIPKAFYSDNGLVLKPMIGKGARGIQYLNENHFVMEKLEGEEIDVDILSLDREVLLCQYKTREKVYGGTLVEGQIVDRSHLFKYVKTIIEKLPLDYLSVIQFKGDKLLEVNPRMAGAIIDQNIPLMAVNLALGKITKEEIKNYKQPIGKRIARTMHNYVF